MSESRYFSKGELEMIHSAILRIYFRIAQVDGTIDLKERKALFDLLDRTSFTSEVFRETLRALKDNMPQAFTNYLDSSTSFEESMQQVRTILLAKLPASDARAFVADIAQLASAVAEASASGPFDDQNVSPAEKELVEQLVTLLNPAHAKA